MLYAACSEARRNFALAQVKKRPLRELCFSHFPHLEAPLAVGVVETYPDSECLSDIIPKLEILVPQVVQALNFNLLFHHLQLLLHRCFHRLHKHL